ncbi:MAG: hypothetical protein A2Y15_08660 [Clostridiales bacterium GWF2_36_10]|nr:MAG: hypothetical protein A2Y15_08660 [Clostridiales bacterium GWF2_36_10]HAN20414.1 hypothetical protein [Clostridiales bacterium]
MPVRFIYARKESVHVSEKKKKQKQKKQPAKDIRALCYRCQNDYILAGYKLILISKIRQPCFRCEWFGFTFEVIDKENKIC